jgi:hypothetical protein
LSLFFSLLLGCGFELSGPAKIALDYRIDQPRMVAMSVNPPVLQPNTPVTLETLILTPNGLEATSVRWEVCGLRDDTWVQDWGLDCFTSNPDSITVLTEGNPGEWSPEASNAPCDRTPCSHSLPLLATAQIDGEDYRSVAYVSILGSEVVSEEGLALPTLRDLGVKLTKKPLGNGSLYLEASVDSQVQDLAWRWYVDDGVLIKTGRTSTQGSREAISTWEDIDTRKSRDVWWTDNIWELPKAPGRYRAVAIASGWYMPGNEKGEGSKDDWKDDDSSLSDDLYLLGGSNPSQTWTIVEVTVK